MITKDYLNFHRTARHIYLLVSSERGYSLRLNTGEEGNVIKHAGLTAKGDGSIGLISSHFFSQK